MESSLIRILPACLTSPLPAGWDAATPNYVVEVMDAVERPEVVTLSIQTTEPDVLLLDADFPDFDPYLLTEEALRTRQELAVVIISSANAPDNLRKAMLAGAEEYLIKPLDADALRESIAAIASHRTLRSGSYSGGEAEGEQDKQPGVVVGIVSGKGGLGKTLLSVNLATVVAKTAGQSAALVGLESGDAAILLSLQPKLGMLDLANVASNDEAAYSPDVLKQYGISHKSGLSYWTWQGSGTQPGAAIPEDFFHFFFDVLRKMANVTVVDFPLLSPEEVTTVLPLLDIVIVVSCSSDLLALRSTKTFLDTIPGDISQRVRVVVNRADASDMINQSDFEQTLEHKVAAIIPNLPKIAAESINMGSPFVLTQPNSELSVAVRELAQTLFKLPVADQGGKPKRRFMLF